VLRRAPEAHDATTRSGRPRKRARDDAVGALGAEHRVLFDALKSWRRLLAIEQGVPPYVIFGDRSLAEIALMRPASLSDLALVNGVGEAKLARYGQAVLKLVREN
jgi:ATP-dependent DNA helicase RecQ